MGSSTKSIPVYSVEIRDSDREFKFQTENKQAREECAFGIA